MDFLVSGCSTEKCVDSFNSQPLVSDFVLSWVKFENNLICVHWQQCTFSDEAEGAL
jgi:hypothetical protein